MTTINTLLDRANARDAANGMSAAEKCKQRLVKPLVGVLAAVAIGGGSVAYARHAAQETRSKVVVSEDQPHREVIVGQLGDADSDPTTPDTPLRTLWGVANAAQISGVDTADVVSILGSQLQKQGKTANLQPGQKIVLPPNAKVGELHDQTSPTNIPNLG